MSRLPVPVVGACLLLCLSTPLLAQDPPIAAPQVLVFTREEIKPGQMEAHEKSAVQFASVLSRASATGNRIALTPIAGDTNVVAYIEGYPSFAAFETATQELDQGVLANASLQSEMDQVLKNGSLHESQRTMLFARRTDLSYRPNPVETVARNRYMTFVTVRVKVGRAADYAAYLRTLNAAREKADADLHNVVYQTAGGTAPATFLIVSSHRSLAALDEMWASARDRQKAIDAALGGEEAARKLRETHSDLVLNADTVIYAMRPNMSRPRPEFVAADSAFWAPAAASGKALAVKKQPKTVAAPKQ